MLPKRDWIEEARAELVEFVGQQETLEVVRETPQENPRPDEIDLKVVDGEIEGVMPRQQMTRFVELVIAQT